MKKSFQLPFRVQYLKPQIAFKTRDNMNGMTIK